MIHACSLLSIFWNPSPVLFYIPWIERPVLWYGFLFMLGFLLGYFIVVPMLVKVLKTETPADSPSHIKQEAKLLADKLTWLLILGSIIGARLGHVLFYYWPMYRNHPLDILKIWEGGLASHGGVIGILIAIYLFRRSIAKKHPDLTFLKIADILTVPAALAGCFIRIGNFFNQEILGTVTTVPWAVVFGNPADGSLPTPRHPVQLYEAFTNLIIFVFLWIVWNKTSVRKKPGTTLGLCFIAIFSARIFFEMFKEPQSLMLDEVWLSTGQLLSIPVVLAGALLCTYNTYQNQTCQSDSK